MNLLGKLGKQFGLIGLLALFFISCNDDDNSIGFNGETDQFKVFFTEFPLSGTVVKRDSVITQNQSTLLVGNYDDPEFGKVGAKAYTQATFQSSQTIIETSTYDSIVLYLKADYFYGNDFGAEQKITVRQLQDTINTDTIFYSFNTMEAEEALNLRDERYRIPDNDSTVAIRLKDEFGLELFSKAIARSVEFSTFAGFNRFFKGLVLEGDENNTAIYGFNPALADTKLSIHYQTPTDSTPFNQEYIINFNNVFNFNNITPNALPSREGTELAGITEFHTAFDTPGDYLYSQNGTGEMIRLDLSEFENLRDVDSLQNILVNSAELVIGEVKNFDDGLPPPTSLRYYLTDETNKFIVREGETFFRSIQNDIPGISPLRSGDQLIQAFDPTKRSYSAVITLYLQEVIDGNMDLTEVLVSPSETSGFVNRYVVDKDNVKIRMFYTIPQ